MMIRRKRGWELPDRAATPEAVFNDRRRLVQAIAAGPILAAGVGFFGRGAAAQKVDDDPSGKLYPVKQNPRFTLDRKLTDEKLATTYNNFYEFGSQKEISQAAQILKVRPWTVEITGLVEEKRTVDIDTLLAKLPLEERLYRHRCVEAWSMAVPWSGIPMKALVDYARPLGSAKFIAMTTFQDAKMAPGQKQFWYPWPYIEGLTMAEATNELAFIATGLYGKPLPKQNGAPIRLVTPWKYGFKSIKSIVKLEFTEKRPVSFWETIQAQEYGFWANVNPEVPHPRWSQASERVLGTNERVPTLLFNGYAEFVAEIYKDLKGERLYA
ncbi:MAG: protein-methionine-sulfoxide reductase catalytic subunit MsrP [Proteobacteria bacterium]|nr:protein-methionine-sulfoxide reductase catalytic subunit MsrP [Pseudomonadota bacterium]MBI3499755.1 protein-methionine-sulfoxide reductase catalytic subunit MsrP [Pseudomonadota bacterium]